MENHEVQLCFRRPKNSFHIFQVMGDDMVVEVSCVTIPTGVLSRKMTLTLREG
jgi:uncharacterized membrane protein